MATANNKTFILFKVALWQAIGDCKMDSGEVTKLPQILSSGGC
jgi:hypothetical protein